MRIPALASSVELITVDSHPGGTFAHVEPEAVGSIAILAASFAHVEPEAVGSIAIFAAAAPRARSSKPSDTLGWNVAGP